MRRLLASLALGCAAAAAQAQGLPAGVAQALKNAQIPPSAVAVVVQPVDSRFTAVNHNAKAAMNPASVMKLVTTYAGLDLLGPAWTWKTTAYTEADPFEGKLGGNLYLKGSGDPKFALEHFWALLRQLRVRGIEHIVGDVVLDRSVFNVPALDPGAFDDKPMRPYNVGPDGLLVNFRALRFSIVAEGSKVRVLQETPSDGLTVDNRLQLTNGTCSSDWKDFVTTRLVPQNGGNRLEFTGSFSAQCGEKNLNLSPLTAEAQVEGLFRALWKELGGSLGGRVRAGTVPATARPVAVQESPSLADAVRDINKYSNNVMARQLFLTLGNDSAPATPERARQRVLDWLAGRGLKFPELVLENGSGLSRVERISADSLNRLLLDAWKNPVMPELVSSLPIVGIDGTMKKRLKESAATGRAHIKTGTLDGAKTAAGFALDNQGRRYAVTFLINHPRAAAGGPAIDALLLWVAQRGTKDATGLEPVDDR